SGNANALALILAAVFVAIVTYNGNFPALLAQIKGDFLGTGDQGAFWKWALALIILYALASNTTTNQFFGPLLAAAILAMLIGTAERNPSAWQNLRGSIDSLFGTAKTN